MGGMKIMMENWITHAESLRSTEHRNLPRDAVSEFHTRHKEQELKSWVYADKPQTLDHFEDNIRRVTADIRPQMLEKVIENWTSKLDYIRASRSSPCQKSYLKCNATRLSFE
ncbi:hypothetical protein TNCV_355231 [Trichonephila clavipes]|uniref:Uncharacterized protein n=1 Tax=Trichonephila clavipes TaxID=2585209 RepID=A0A8X7BD95_TRICX|nr:hypothetical protein TNCV_355231 [Trichonephila clavipes]